MFFDFQIHSRFSFDSFSGVADILNVAKHKGLAGVAITDHQSYKGSAQAAKLASVYDLLVVPAEEISTEEGDVIGLFIREEVTSRAFYEVVGEVKEQGGILMLPHPFKRRRQIPQRVLDNIDIVEVFNARGQSVVDYDCNDAAFQLALQERLPMVAGSDAHFLWEIGRGKMRLQHVSGIDDLRDRVLQNFSGEIFRQPSSLYCDVLSQMVKAYKWHNARVILDNLQRFKAITKWHINRTLKK